MKVLIAEDDQVSRTVLEIALKKWQYEPISYTDGSQAWEALQKDDAPQLAVLDWMMPELDGPEICRRLRALDKSNRTYVIMLTAKAEKSDVVAGLEAGADDYLTKPFNQAELLARVRAGARIIELQNKLASRVQELEEAMELIRGLQKDLDHLIAAAPPTPPL